MEASELSRCSNKKCPLDTDKLEVQNITHQNYYSETLTYLE